MPDVVKSKYANATQMEENIDNAAPIIGDNGNWWRWNVATHRYEDTGKQSFGKPANLEIVDIKKLSSEAEPYIEEVESSTPAYRKYILYVPQGVQGESGTIQIEDIVMLESGEEPFARNSGTPENAVYTLGIPRGLTGNAATIEIGEVNTGEPGTQVIIDNVGDENHAILNITIPRGDTGGTDSLALKDLSNVSNEDFKTKAESSGFGIGQATEEKAGIIKLATQSMAEAGTDDTAAMTAKQTSANFNKKWIEKLTDGTNVARGYMKNYATIPKSIFDNIKTPYPYCGEIGNYDTAPDTGSWIVIYIPNAAINGFTVQILFSIVTNKLPKYRLSNGVTWSAYYNFADGGNAAMLGGILPSAFWQNKTAGIQIGGDGGYNIKLDYQGRLVFSGGGNIPGFYTIRNIAMGSSSSPTASSQNTDIYIERAAGGDKVHTLVGGVWS